MTRLGAGWDGSATTFALRCCPASTVLLCLFDAAGRETRHPMELVDGVWRREVPGAGPGQRYGYRVDGPWEPAAGLWCNPSRLLLDPYARAVDGGLVLADAVLSPGSGHHAQPDPRDTAPLVPRSVVVADPPPAPARRARRPWAEQVVYELHVKGFTARHPGVPEHLRGTYAGLAHPAALEHLLTLGVTTVELLPVQHFVSEPHLLRRGLTNYWGYNPVAWFAPHSGYAASGADGAQEELAAMVAALHDVGLEVLVDVVYNHTGEGDEVGPTLSLRGLDNPGAYLLDPADPARYVDHTGCGSTVRVEQQLELVVGSLRHWATTFGIDGFRFDLAPSLLRTGPGGARVDRQAAFLQAVAADPVLRGLVLVAEPWDLGPDGYQLGGFPAPWAEWNDRYRNTVRDFWAGNSSGVGDLATSLAGSSDVFGERGPTASVNLVTAHDGFTLRDLTSYERKRNQANGEDNRDGEDHNRGWDCGVDGETDDAQVNTVRERQARNLLATLLLSAGVPMLSMGDEVRRTQAGNNNAYCQDGATSWMPWDGSPDAAAMLAFVQRLLRLRAAEPALRAGTFATGRPGVDGVADLSWWSADGRPAGPQLWRDLGARTLGMQLDGRPDGGSLLLMLLHAGERQSRFVLPPGRWRRVLDTADPDADTQDVAEADASYLLAPRSVAVLREG